MTVSTRPLRSVLYIPASRARALDKARNLPADAIIFDLEDAVAPDEKTAARNTLAAELDKDGYGPRMKIVRINGLDTGLAEADLAAVAPTNPDAILVPKVDAAVDVDRIAALTDLPIWAMMETPRGILNAAGIAAHAAMSGFVLGTNDLAKDLGARNRAAMTTAIQTCLLAARANGIACIDGVYNAFKDEEGLRAECREGCDWGMDGKTLIHPAQLAIANEVFAPSEDEIDLARRQIDAFESALADGAGVAVVDGKIVENLHVETARAILARAAAIREIEGAA